MKKVGLEEVHPKGGKSEMRKMDEGLALSSLYDYM